MRRLRLLISGPALVALLVVLSARSAQADAILKLQNTNGSPYENLNAILSSSYDIASLINGSPSSGSINVTNDVSGGIGSLTLYYYGVTGPANDAGSTLTCQNFSFGGDTTTCSVFDPNNGMYYYNGAKTPNDLSLAAYAFTWNFATPLTGNFNIAWSSFSGTGYTGCISGSPTCSAFVPEPSSLTLLTAGLFSLIGFVGFAGYRKSPRLI